MNYFSSHYKCIYMYLKEMPILITPNLVNNFQGTKSVAELKFTQCLRSNYCFKIYVSVNEISAKLQLMPFLVLRVHSATYNILQDIKSNQNNG